MVVSYGNSVTYLQYPVNTTYNICCGSFSFVFEVLRCFALSYVLNPEGTSDLSKWKKKVGFWDVFISKTSDVKICLSVQSIFQSLCFSLIDLYLQYPQHIQKLDSLAPNRPKFWKSSGNQVSPFISWTRRFWINLDSVAFSIHIVNRDWHFNK